MRQLILLHIECLPPSALTRLQLAYNTIQQAKQANLCKMQRKPWPLASFVPCAIHRQLADKVTGPPRIMDSGTRHRGCSSFLQ